nr:putative transcriptional regulatory protein c3c7.04 [Quercus suber]
MDKQSVFDISTEGEDALSQMGDADGNLFFKQGTVLLATSTGIMPDPSTSSMYRICNLFVMVSKSSQQPGRVRKRVSNACIRCRRQKIKCSGSDPCEQCSRRDLVCNFEQAQHKILVSQSYIARLERAAGALRTTEGQLISTQNPSLTDSEHDDTSDDDRTCADLHPDPHFDDSSRSEDIPQGNVVRMATDTRLKNPLTTADDSLSYTFDSAGRRFFLGVSSNWSFGRRVLTMAHETACGECLPALNLLFEGSTYDLKWDGRRSNAGIDTTGLPTSDFAMFLINAVKFHCGQLFHVFDERNFMNHFKKFYEKPDNDHDRPILWYIHYLLILALGKAFMARTGTGRHPPGVDSFVQAMQLMPDIIFLCTDPLPAIEVLCCASIYLQCLDMRSAAWNLIGQAMRICLEQGMHIDASNYLLSDETTERRREAWWTTYILDRQMSALLGVPTSIPDHEVTALLPSFAGSVHKSSALNVHVKLFYRQNNNSGNKFLENVKQALRTLADANDERITTFPIDLNTSAGGICRLSAYLQLFHHQCLILSTRPLLFSFWQKRLEICKPLRVSSAHGVRSLLRVCIRSAQQSLSILNVLQQQCLLVVDPSLLQQESPWQQIVQDILDEMARRGNMIAASHQRELAQLQVNIQKLRAMNGPATYAPESADCLSVTKKRSVDGTVDTSPKEYLLTGWHSEDDLSGEQLLAVAESFSLEQFDWLADGELPADFFTT